MQKSSKDQAEENELRAHYKKNLAVFADELPELNTFTFMQLRDFMEPKDSEAYQNTIKSQAKKTGISLLAGFGINLGITSVNPTGFLKWNKYSRFSVRSSIYVASFVASMVFLQKPEIAKFQELEGKYNKRMRKFRISKDFADMDPEGLIFQDYMQKMNKTLGK